MSKTKTIIAIIFVLFISASASFALDGNPAVYPKVTSSPACDQAAKIAEIMARERANGDYVPFPNRWRAGREVEFFLKHVELKIHTLPRSNDPEIQEQAIMDFKAQMHAECLDTRIPTIIKRRRNGQMIMRDPWTGETIIVE